MGKKAVKDYHHSKFLNEQEGREARARSATITKPLDVFGVISPKVK